MSRRDIGVQCFPAHMLRHLSLGFIRTHILFHAAEGPVYGTALMVELGRHGYRVGPGTLYPILHGLEQKGLLRREDEVVEGKVRKYYRTTPAGRRTLARAEVQLRELVEEVLPSSRSRVSTRSLRSRNGK
jgi:PadR family transcriptional regulator, regulatory protein PadR